jgi:hypothetical protein
VLVDHGFVITVERDRKTKPELTLRDLYVLGKAVAATASTRAAGNVNFVKAHISVFLGVSLSVLGEVFADTLEVFVDRLTLLEG